jgi:hypothetical protein
MMAESMQLTCNLIAERAQQLAVSAQAVRAGAVREHRAELTALVARHLEGAERRLSPVAKRALLHDHRRCAQLVRAIELALDDSDFAQAAARARELARFAVTHEEKERPYLSCDD